MTQTIINLGTGGAALNGRNGSTAGADSNDALFLDWPGDNQGNYVYLPGVNGNRLTVPDENALDITGDIDLRAYVALDSWLPATPQAFINKRDAVASNNSFFFGLTSTGLLQFAWSETGTSTTAAVNSTVATGVTDFTAKWVRVTFDVDNGASGKDLKFFLSDDGVSWTQLGSTLTLVGVTSIFSGGAPVVVGSAVSTGGNHASGKFYRAQVFNGIDGTKVLDVDTSVITSGAATSFTALTGQTVTINRSAAGRKAVAVVSSLWLFGTDDYMEVADNALLDFGGSDSFTLLAVHRPWATQGTNDTLIAKKANATDTTQGYSLSGGSSTALQTQSQIGDGAAGITAVSGSRTSGQLAITAAVRDVTADNLTVYLNGTAGTAITDTTTGSLSNAEVFRVARLSGAGTEYADMELIGVALFRRALTATEIGQITTYYQARLS